MKNTGLTGFARCGKDTLAKELSKILGVDTYALAQPIKDIMCALFGWGEEQRDGSYKEINMLYSISPATIDQAGILYSEYGLDEYEAFHDCWDKLVILFGVVIEEDDLAYCIISPRVAFQLFGTEWGRAIDNDIWLKTAPKDNTIITDIRFDNEAQYFKDIGAEIISIERPGFRPVNNGHVSEAGVRKELVDHEILNDGTIEQLLDTAALVAKQLKEKHE